MFASVERAAWTAAAGSGCSLPTWSLCRTPRTRSA